MEIDLTQVIAERGTNFVYQNDFLPDDSLLQYPQSRFSNVHVDFDVIAGKNKVEISGDVVVSISGVCDRCCEDICNTFTLPFSQTFLREGEDGECEYRYSGSSIDLTKAVCDEIVLGLPISFLCDENCKGLCPVCGCNLNKNKCDCTVEKENAFSVLKNLKF